MDSRTEEYRQMLQKCIRENTVNNYLERNLRRRTEQALAERKDKPVHSAMLLGALNKLVDKPLHEDWVDEKTIGINLKDTKQLPDN